MWKLRGCPRCAGDIFLERDLYGWFEQCLQCGYRSDLEVVAEIKEKPEEERGKKASSVA